MRQHLASEVILIVTNIQKKIGFIFVILSRLLMFNLKITIQSYEQHLVTVTQCSGTKIPFSLNDSLSPTYKTLKIKVQTKGFFIINSIHRSKKTIISPHLTNSDRETSPFHWFPHHKSNLPISHSTCEPLGGHLDFPDPFLHSTPYTCSSHGSPYV